MPIYVWQCGECGRVEEQMQSGFNPVPPHCDACALTMRQVFAAPGVVLKGDGWATRLPKGGKK